MIAEISLWPKAASTTAHHVDQLFLFLLAVCGSVGLLVAVLLIYFCIRYRRRSGAVGNPPDVRQSRALEWFWTLTPLGVFAVLFAWGGEVYFTAFSPPDDATPVYVVAKQWMWKFQHPEGQREINTLHVPVGKPIKLLLISQDVIHSFFVPAFRVHMDVLPQRYTSVWFQATEPGEYHLFCSQYCGTNHSGMVGTVVAMKDGRLSALVEFQRRRLAGARRAANCFCSTAALAAIARTPRPARRCWKICMARSVALNDGRAVRAEHDYLRNAILKPSAEIVAGYRDIMPPFDRQISEEQVLALIAYIQSLKPGGTPSRVEDYPPPARTQPTTR